MSDRIAVGDALPTFSCEDQDGSLVRSQDFLGSWLVLFFYPKNDTPICTKEACSFRDAYDVFQKKGAKVVGVSSDSGSSHRTFRENHRLPYPLLSDQDGQLRELLGVPKSLFFFPGRVTYVIGPKGIVRHVFNSAFSSTRHVEEALSIITMPQET